MSLPLTTTSSTAAQIASADLLVRLFHGEELKRVFSGHTDVVRAIALLPRRAVSDENDKEDLFVTASNDSTLCIWSLDDRRCPPGQPTNGGKPLKVLKQDTGGSDLLYDVKYIGNLIENKARVVISCGEDGLLRGWDVDEGVVLFSIPQPVTSVWALTLLPLSGDIATANSDNKVRIFTQRSRAKTENKTSPGDSSLIGEVTEEELQEHERLCREVVSSKSTSAEVTEQTVEAPEQDNTIDDVKYDCVLKIDVTDDAEPLSLGVNRGDDVRLVSQAFIAKHSLPASYEDQIVAFIEQVGPR